MVFISKKIIKGKKRYYLERTIRLHDGKVKKFSVYLKDYNPKKRYTKIRYCREQLNFQINKAVIDYATKHYRKTPIFNEELLKRLEEIKLRHKKIRKKLSEAQIQDIIDRFTVNFTYESNAIEGNSLTLKDVTMILHEKKAIRGKDLREIYETLNTRDAMELVFNNKLTIKEEDIIRLHKIIVRNTGVVAGYKTLPNFLLGRKTQTTPPEMVEQEMSELIEWYHKNKHTHPLQKAAIFHGRFEKIHPFEDGNGRVGRLLINVILINHGYPPLIIRETQRISYFNSLEAFDNGYEDKLSRFLVDKYKETYEKFFEVYVRYVG